MNTNLFNSLVIGSIIILCLLFPRKRWRNYLMAHKMIVHSICIIYCMYAWMVGLILAARIIKDIMNEGVDNDLPSLVVLAAVFLFPFILGASALVARATILKNRGNPGRDMNRGRNED